MKEDKILKIAENLAGAIWENPFSDGDNTIILRHGKGGKWFGALINAPRRSLALAGEGYARVLNVKCEPMLAAMLIQNYRDIFPAYHMNKTHWISLLLDGALPEEEFEKLLNLSYALTLPKARRKFD